MKGWSCVRYGDSLAWVEAPSEAEAVRRSLDLHPLGDWTDDARWLVAFPQDVYPGHSGPHDYTRAVLNADPAPRCRRVNRHKPPRVCVTSREPLPDERRGRGRVGRRPEPVLIRGTHLATSPYAYALSSRCHSRAGDSGRPHG